MALKIVHHPEFQAKLKPGHRFPMGKYGAVADALVEAGIASGETFFRPAMAAAEWIALAHSRRYVDQVFSCTVPLEISKRIGFDVSESVSKRARLSCSATVLTARLALEHGIAASTAGGSHHAQSDFGAGFCVFNDVAVAARVLLADREVDRIMVFDCDVHQGDGTAEIFRNDDRVFTVSLHADSNYPYEKIKSDLDIGLPDGLGDEAYLKHLHEALELAVGAFDPQIVFYNGGVDPHADDALGKLALSDTGLAARDRMVFGFFRNREVPIAAVLGGGYSRDIATLAKRHAQMFSVAASFA